MDLNTLLIDLAKLAGLGVIIGIGARLALPGDQRMGPANGVAGAFIGGGLALLLDLSDMFVALAGTLVSILLIGALHQHGVLVPEDAHEGEGPAHQGHDLLDMVTHNDHGDLDRELITDEVEAHEAAEAAAEDGALVIEEHTIAIVEPEAVEAPMVDDALVDDAPVEVADDAPADEAAAGSDYVADDDASSE